MYIYCDDAVRRNGRRNMFSCFRAFIPNSYIHSRVYNDDDFWKVKDIWEGAREGGQANDVLRIMNDGMYLRGESLNVTMRSRRLAHNKILLNIKIHFYVGIYDAHISNVHRRLGGVLHHCTQCLCMFLGCMLSLQFKIVYGFGSLLMCEYTYKKRVYMWKIQHLIKQKIHLNTFGIIKLLCFKHSIQSAKYLCIL